jgi:glycosyltransferase involved in cell wall biosynthesis
MQIVWFSEIKWDYLKTRKQQIISRKPADLQLLFLEPFVKGRRNFYRLRTEGDIFCATIPFVKTAPTSLWRSVLDRQSARLAVDLVARSRIQSLLHGLKFDPRRVGFVISNIYAADIAIRLPKKFLLYDCNDDHSKFPGMRSWTEAYFYRTSRNADSVFASSRALLEKVSTVRGDARECHYLGNGVDFAHFQNGTADTEQAARQGTPRIGYIGALAPWVDFEATAELARRHPEWEIVLVGPILHKVDEQVLKLTSLPNVFHLPAVSYDRLPGILRQFTLGLIPFRYNELTAGVNPNKLYEYLAAGLPVVSTRFSEEVQKYPDLVKSVDPGDDFVRACEETMKAVSDPGSRSRIAEKARQAARENDWDVIAKKFWDKVREMTDSP